jgi:hypothetical protein
MNSLPSSTPTALAAAVLILGLAAEADAQHGGRAAGARAAGTGARASAANTGFSNAGAASGGGFSQGRQGSAASNTQINYNNNGGSCHNCSNWDAATGFVAGAAVTGAVVAASTPPPPGTVVVAAAPAPVAAPVAPPCNAAPIPVDGEPYYRCGSTWYAAAYSSSGVVYMPVPAPAGY